MSRSRIEYYRKGGGGSSGGKSSGGSSSGGSGSGSSGGKSSGSSGGSGSGGSSPAPSRAAAVVSAPVMAASAPGSRQAQMGAASYSPPKITSGGGGKKDDDKGGGGKKDNDKGGGGKKDDDKGGARNAVAAVNAAVSYQQQQQQPSKQETKIAEAKQTAREQIAGISASSSIPDPQAYKNALDKLKKLGADKAVERIQDEKKEAKAQVAQRPTALPTPDTNTSGPSVNPAYEDQIKTLTDQLSSLQSGVASKDDLIAALQQQSEKSAADFQNWKQEYETRSQQTQAAANANTPTSAAAVPTTAEAAPKDEFELDPFDPDLFRDLLSELESSRYRQKQWNERSAKTSYNF